MSSEQGLICAYAFDGEGGAKSMDWEDIAAWRREQGALWIHLDRADTGARQWLKQSGGVDPVVADALLGKGSRPRSLAAKGGYLVILRGVNLNPGEDPVDMVSIRMFVQPDRIISLRRQNLMAVNDIQASIADGEGPRDVGDFLVMIAERLVDRMTPPVTSMHEELNTFERELTADVTRPARSRLAELRRSAINFHRDLAPQREALSQLLHDDIDWLDEDHKLRLNEIDDQMARYVENLAASEERAEVVHDRITDSLAEQMNRNMYILSIVAAVFLPLDFITGLFGVNLRGIPGGESPWSFAVMTVGLAALAGVLALFFARLGMIRPIRHQGSG